MSFEDIYEAVYETYYPPGMWDRMVQAGEPDSLNLAEEALGRHGDSEETALRIRDFETGADEVYSFAELNDAANRAANYFEETMNRGERFGVMLPAVLERYAAIFGGIKSHRMFVPLDTKFGPEALSYRLDDAGATTIVTTPEYLDAVEPDAVDSLERVIVVGGGDETVGDLEVVGYEEVASASSDYEAIRMHPTQPYSVGYSSGTTGQPSQDPSPHATCVAIEPYLTYVVDMQPEDTYFAAASPAWAYGLTVGTLSPGLRGTNIGAYRGRFDLEVWLQTLEDWEVTNAMVAPTALRQLKASDIDVGSYDIDLRVLVTAGETLDEATAEWVRENLGTPALDAYGLSEGGMVLCNYPFPDWEIKPGSMGKPLPGYDVALLETDDGVGTGEPVPEDEVTVIEDHGETGEIGIHMTGGHGPIEGMMDEGWLRTGDLAEVDEDGYWWYRGRADEVIISAGYRIGPEEVQATLTDHDAVEEAGVIGVPHETRGNIVKGFITLAPGHEESADLLEEITQFTKAELSKHEYPRELEVVEELPKTASDKILRRELYERHDGD